MTSHVVQPVTALFGPLADPTACPAQLPMHLVKMFAAELRRRRAVREIGELDDRMLADIGLRRGEIGYAAHFGRAALLNRAPRGLPALSTPKTKNWSGASVDFFSGCFPMFFPPQKQTGAERPP